MCTGSAAEVPTSKSKDYDGAREAQEKMHPTRMPSSMSVGATLSPSPTTNCATKGHFKQ